MATTAPFPVPDPMLGRALFSTCDCRYAPRWAPWPPRKSVIIRSDPEDDMKLMALRLQEKFPEICKTIVGPIQPQQVYEYFDHNDADLQGFSFLITVLERIALFNRNYVCNVEDFVKRWMATNAEAFPLIEANHEVEHLFKEEDIEEYGAAFSSDAMLRIKNMRTEHDEQQQDILRVQQQHAQMIQHHAEFIRSTAPASAPFPDDPSPQPGLVVSNPEGPQPHLREGSIHQLQAPEGRFPIPLISFNPPPQGPRRGDFHSDPVPAPGQTHPENFMGVPSRGIPGPYSYGTLPVPINLRRAAYPGTMPRSRKNPAKTLSDDARLQLNIKNGPTGHSHQRSSALLPPVLSTESMQTPNQFMGHVQYTAQGPGRYWNGHNYPPRHVVVGQPPPQAPPLQTHHQQADNTAQPTDVHGLVPVGQTGVPTPLSDQRSYISTADTDRPALTNMSNAEQAQGQKAPESKPQSGQAPPMAEPCKLWIGNIPPDTLRGAVMHILQPYPGLIEVSDVFTKMTAHSEAFKYVFATFENPSYAEEALNLIPKSQFDGLQGRSLKVEWASRKVFTPKHYRYRDGGYNGSLSMNTSPAKSHEASNMGAHQSRVSLTESERRHLTSEGSPVTSRKSSNAGLQRSCGVSDHRRKQSGGSGSPQKRSNKSVAKKTAEKAATPSDLKVVEGNANSKYDSVSQPVGTKVEDIATLKEHNANAESGSGAAQSTAEVNDRSIQSQSGFSENVNPSRASHPWAELSALDGVQDTVPSARNRQPSHKTTKSSPSNKALIPDGKAKSLSQGPTTPQKPKSAGKKPVPINESKSKSKGAASGNNRNQQGQAKTDPPKVSATVGTSLLPNENAHGIQAASNPQHAISSCNDVSKLSQDPSIFESRASESSNAFHTTAGASTRAPKQTEPATSATPSSYDQKPTSQAMSRDTTRSTDDSVSATSTSTTPTSLPRDERSGPTSQAMSRDTTKTSDDSMSPVSSTALTFFDQDNRLDRTRKSVRSSKSNSEVVSVKETKPSMPGIDPDQLQRQLQANAVLPGSVRDEGDRLDEDAQASASEPKVSQSTPKMAPEAIASNQMAESLARSGDVTPNTRQVVIEEALVYSPTKSLKEMNITGSSQSPQRKAAPEVPQRSSSLTESSTPIKTHKKKARKFSPVEEESRGATGQKDSDETVLEKSASLHTNLPSATSVPVHPSPSKEETMSKSKKKRSKKSRTLAPLIIAPAEQTTSLESRALPKPETPYLTDDGDPCNTYNKPIVEGKALLPQPETPFVTDDGGDLPAPKLRSPLRSMTGLTPILINKPTITTADLSIATNYQDFQHHRGLRTSDSKTPLSGRKALPKLEDSLFADGNASKAPAVLSIGETSVQRPHQKKDWSYKAAPKIAPSTLEAPSVSRTGSAIDDANDQYSKCVPGGIEAAQRNVGKQNPPGNRIYQGPLLIQAQTALEYTAGPAEDAEHAEYMLSGDPRSTSWLEAAVPVTKAVYDTATDSPPLSPDNVCGYKPIKVDPKAIETKEGLLRDVISFFASAAETEQNKRLRREAEYLLKISPGKPMSEPQSEFMSRIVNPQSWVKKVREYMQELTRLDAQGRTDSNAINDETSPLLVADISCIESAVRSALSKTSMKLDSEKKLGHNTNALRINCSKFKSLVDRSPRFQSSPTELEMEEWVNEASRWLTTHVALFEKLDSPPNALAAVNAKIAELESKKSQKKVQQKPRQSRVMSGGKGVLTPSSSPETLGRRTSSEERAGPSRSLESPDDTRKLAAAVERKGNEVRRLQAENLEDRSLKDMKPHGSGSQPENDISQVSIRMRELEVAEILTKMTEYGHTRAQEDMLEEMQDVNNEGTSSANAESYETATAEQHVDINDSASSSTLKSDGEPSDELDANTENHDREEHQVAKAEDTDNDGEDMQGEQFQTHDEKPEALPVIPPSEVRRRYSIIQTLFTEEELAKDPYNIAQEQEGLLSVQETDRLFGEEEQEKYSTIDEAEEVLTAPTVRVDKTATDKEPARAGGDSGQHPHAPEPSAVPIPSGSDFGDVKSDDGASVVSNYDEEFPQLGIRGGYTPGKGRGRTQSYVAALATGQALRQAGGQSRASSKGPAAGQAGGPSRTQSAGHSRANSPNKSEAKAPVNDAWGVPTQEGAWGKGGQGVKKPA